MRIPDVAATPGGTPPPAPEATGHPERAEAMFDARVGVAQVPVDQRPDFGRLDVSSQRTVLQYREVGDPVVGSVKASSRGAYFASTTPGARMNPTEYRTTNNTIAQSMQETIDRPTADGSDNLEGVSDRDIFRLFHHAAVRADQDVAMTGEPANSSVGIVRLFRGEDGKEKAALFGAGNVAILRLRKNETETLIVPQESLSASDPRVLNTFTGKGRVDPTDDSRTHDELRIVDVKRGDRFVVVDGGMQDPDFNGFADLHHIADAARGISDPNEAAAAIAEVPIRDPRDRSAGGVFDEISVAVVDADPLTLREKMRDLPKAVWSLGKKAVAATLTTLGEIRTGNGKVAAFRDKLVAKYKDEYEAHPTRTKYAAYIGISAAAVALTAFGSYQMYRLTGAAVHGVEGMFGHDGPTVLPDPLHRHTHDETGAPAPGATTETTPPAGATAPGAPEGITLPNGTTLPEHLPEGVHLSHENTDWLKGHTGGGEVGAYDTDHLPADGTGYDGTVWNSALEGLKQLGYDPNHMSVGERTEYVNHVLALNHLDPESAKHIANDFGVRVPTNADAIATITRITGTDGHPLLPAHGSIADHHITAIRDEIQAQAGHSAAGGHVDSGAAHGGGHPAGDHEPSGRPATPDRDPGVGQPQPTASPDAQAAAPTDQEWHGGIRNAPFGLTMTAAGLAAATSAGLTAKLGHELYQDSKTRRRATPPPPPTAYTPRTLPEDVARKRSADGSPEDDDDTDEEESHTLRRTPKS